MTTPHWRLILNGKSAGNDDLRSAVGRLREQNLVLDVRVTWEGGDSERYVAEAIAEKRHHGPGRHEAMLEIRNLHAEVDFGRSVGREVW